MLIEVSQGARKTVVKEDMEGEDSRISLIPDVSLYMNQCELIIPLEHSKRLQRNRFECSNGIISSC